MKYYCKLLVQSTDFRCLRSNWESLIHLVCLSDGEPCPTGYMPFVIANERPALAEGCVMGYHCVVTDGSLYRTYEAVTEAQSKARPYCLPRTFSKLKLETALLKRGLLDELDAFLDSTCIEGTNYALRRFYDQANDLSESHPMYDTYCAAAKTALGVDDETAEEILRESAL